MVRGNYPVQDVEGSKSKTKDSSYKSCVITMFIVFLICIIIILIFWRTKYIPAEDTGTKLDAHVGVSSKLTSESPVFTTTQLDITTNLIPSTITNKDDTSMPATVSTVKYDEIKRAIEGYQNVTTDTTDSTYVTQSETILDLTTPDNLSFSSKSRPTATEVTTDITVTQNISSILITGVLTTADTETTTLLEITTDLSETTPYVQPNTTSETIDTTVFQNMSSVLISGVFTTTNLNDTETTTFHGITTDLTETTPDDTTPNIATKTVVTDPDTTESSVATFNDTTLVFATTVVANNKTSEQTSTVVSDTWTTQPSVTIPIATSVTLNDNKTCQTSECKVLASRMLSLMNHSVKPCDNFYEFACGGLRDNHALLQEDPEQDVWNRIASAVEKVNSSSNVVYQKFRHFYDQCVDYEHIVNQSIRFELGRKVVADVDNMYNTSEWVKEDKAFNFTHLLIKLFNLDSAHLFDISMDVNPQDTTKFQLKLTIPRSKSKLQLESPSVSRCKSHIKSDDAHNIDMTLIYENKYLTCIRNFSEYFTALKTAIMDLELYGKTDAAEVTEHIKNITSFIESDVFSVFQGIDPWNVRVNTQEKKFTTKTVEELQIQYPQVYWDILFGALFNATIDNDTEVQVYFENYFDELFEHLKIRLLDTAGRSVVHNGLLAMLAHDIYMDLVKPRPCDREEYCLRIASGLMKPAASSLYLSTFTSKELSDKEQELVTMFTQLKNILKEEINKTSWLDEEARNNMLDKLSTMTVMAHGSRTILLHSDFENNSFFNNLNFTDKHFENAVELLRQYRKTLYQHIEFNTSAPEAMLFFSLPLDTHPVSVYQLNTVILPFGMVGSWKPTNELPLPSFVWKARIGNKIARQIVHHFDTTGIKYNATGSDTDFLKGNSNDSYTRNYVRCEEVHDYNFTWTSQKNQKYIYQVNAARTMNEHFTDNSAFWLTHKLFNKTVNTEPLLPWLESSHDELYLLLTAQEFCAKAELLEYTVTMFETEHFAPHLRVKNMIEKSAVFDDVYKCPVKTTNDSSWKCAPFPEQDVNLI